MHKRNMQFILLTSIHIQSHKLLWEWLSDLVCLLNLYVIIHSGPTAYQTSQQHPKNSRHQTLDPEGISNLSKSHTNAAIHYTSNEVDIFFSLILSYFCLLVPAFSPCQGRLKNKLCNGKR